MSLLPSRPNGEKAVKEPINCSPVNVPKAYRGHFQVWGEYRVGYKAVLADATSQHTKSFGYAAGVWHESSAGLWFTADVAGCSAYFTSVGRILRVLVRPEDFIFKDQTKARAMFVQAMTPVLFIWPSDEVVWPLMFDPDGGEVLEGPFVEPLYAAPKSKVTAPKATIAGSTSLPLPPFINPMSSISASTFAGGGAVSIDGQPLGQLSSSHHEPDGGTKLGGTFNGHQYDLRVYPDWRSQSLHVEGRVDGYSVGFSVPTFGDPPTERLMSHIIEQALNFLPQGFPPTPAPIIHYEE